MQLGTTAAAAVGVDPAVFIVFGPHEDGVVCPLMGRRITGLWETHFDKSLNNTMGWIWEKFLRSDAWINVAAPPESQQELSRT